MKIDYKTIWLASVISLVGFNLTIADVEIRLWKEACVDTDTVKLRDIATIKGDRILKDALSNLVIGSAGGKKEITIRAWKIVEQLGNAGFNPLEVKLSGSAYCKIKFIQSGETKSAKVLYQPKYINTHISGAYPQNSLRAKIEEVIRAHIGNRRFKNYKVELDFNENVEDLLTLTTPPYRFVIKQGRRNPHWVGLVGFKVSIYRKGELVKVVPIFVNVRIQARVLVARKKINSKAPITAKDVEPLWKDVSRMLNKRFIRLDELEGIRAKRLIRAGTIITDELVEPIPLIKRGQLVVVIYSKRGLEITTVGKALKTGYLNDIIPVRNEKSKGTFLARVIGRGKVLVSNTRTSVVAIRE